MGNGFHLILVTIIDKETLCLAQHESIIPMRFFLTWKLNHAFHHFATAAQIYMFPAIWKRLILWNKLKINWQQKLLKTSVRSVSFQASSEQNFCDIPIDVKKRNGSPGSTLLGFNFNMPKKQTVYQTRQMKENTVQKD